MGQESINLTEALSIFRDHHVDIRKACVENAQEIIKTPHKEFGVDDEWTPENIMLHVKYLEVKEQTEPLVRTIKRIDSKRQHRPGKITEADIEKAREYPIKELFTELTGEKIRQGMAKCPFHSDDTPSFSLRKYNRYRCFGCDERGDVIALYQKLTGETFLQAVRKLK